MLLLPLVEEIAENGIYEGNGKIVGGDGEGTGMSCDSVLRYRTMTTSTEVREGARLEGGAWTGLDSVVPEAGAPGTALPHATRP